MAAWWPPPSPRQPPLPLRPHRLCLLLHLLLTPPRRPPPCLEASSSHLHTRSCTLTPLPTLASSCRSSTSSPCSPTPSRQPRASPTSDRADRAAGEKRRTKVDTSLASGKREETPDRQQTVAAKQLHLTGSSVWEYCALSPHWPPVYTRYTESVTLGILNVFGNQGT